MDGTSRSDLAEQPLPMNQLLGSAAYLSMHLRVFIRRLVLVDAVRFGYLQ